MVDARQLPLSRLDDDVDRPPLELGEAQLEASCVEVIPRVAGLVRDGLLPDAPVASDEVEPELADVAALELADFARHEVVVEDLHGSLASCPVFRELTRAAGR